MAEVRCSVCLQAWGVNTPPALPLYPRGLIMHYCANGERVVRPPRTVEETALVGASVGASRFNAWPQAKHYIAILLDVARVELECGCDIGDSQLAALRAVWGCLTEQERKVVKAELALLRHAEILGAASTCPIGQLDNLNPAPATGDVSAGRSLEQPPEGGG